MMIDRYELRQFDLRRQHVAWTREGYDGHNRRSGLITMHHLHQRRARRVWHQRLARWCSSVEPYWYWDDDLRLPAAGPPAVSAPLVANGRFRFVPRRSTSHTLTDPSF